jgi:hypothetical protein
MAGRLKGQRFDGLKPKGRNDAGKVRKISPEAWEKTVVLKKEVPGRSVRKIIQIMETHQMIQPGEIKPSTLARQFHVHGLDRKTLSRLWRDKTFRRLDTAVCFDFTRNSSSFFGGTKLFAALIRSAPVLAFAKFRAKLIALKARHVR